MQSEKNVFSWLISVILIIALTFVSHSCEAKKEMKKYGPYLAVLEYEETGEFLPEDTKIYVDENGGSMLGKHYHLSCIPVIPENRILGQSSTCSETDKGYLYVPYESLATGQSVALLSDTKIPSPEKYHAFEAVVCGYYKHKDTSVSTSIYPVLKVSPDSYHGSLIDYAAPVISEVEPDESVTEDNVTLTLDKIEYRGNLSRVFLTLKNDGGSRVVIREFSLTCDGEELCGEMVGLVFNPIESLTPFYDKNDVNYPLMIDSGQSAQGVYVIKPCTKYKPLEISMDLADVRYNFDSTADEAVILDDKPEIKLSYDLPEEMIRYEPSTETGTTAKE